MINRMLPVLLPVETRAVFTRSRATAWSVMFLISLSWSSLSEAWVSVMVCFLSRFLLAAYPCMGHGRDTYTHTHHTTHRNTKDNNNINNKHNSSHQFLCESVSRLHESSIRHFLWLRQPFFFSLSSLSMNERMNGTREIHLVRGLSAQSARSRDSSFYCNEERLIDLTNCPTLVLFF